MKHSYAAPGSLIAALDIGSVKTVCFIGRVIDDRGGFEVLGIGHHASEGVKSGAMIDLKRAEETVRKAVHAAEAMAADAMKGYPLHAIMVGVPAKHMRSFPQSVEIDLAGHEVTKQDLTGAIASAGVQVRQAYDQSPLGAGGEGAFEARYHPAHVVRQHVRLDGQGGIEDPIGMSGHHLGVDLHLSYVEHGWLDHVTHCLDRSHLGLDGLCCGAYAAGLASLVEDERDLGALVIDMGGGLTSFAVFHEGQFIYADSVPVGGMHVTQDIATGLTTSLADAERLKVLYGGAMASDLDEGEMIDVPRLGEEDLRTPNHVQRSVLVGMIQPRMEEIFELVRARLTDYGLDRHLGRRVVLTGGASQLHGAQDLAAHVLDKQVRTGRPVQTGALPDAVSGPAFSCVFGMLRYMASCRHEDAQLYFKPAKAQNIFAAAKQWLKENW